MRPSHSLLLGLSGPELTPEEFALFRDVQPGGFILFTRNLVSALQTRQLTDTLRQLCDHTPFIGIDNEGGRVWRTSPFLPSPPSARQLRIKGDPRIIAEVGWATGQMLAMLGINLNLAPVLDIDHHPQAENSLNGRCWGEGDQEVINHAGTFNRWQRRQGILGCAKHFPGGGQAQADPHHGLPSTSVSIDELQRKDLVPYTALMPELDAIMVSHIHFSRIDENNLPASLSRNIIQGLLRDRLGFDQHLVLTDDLDMGAIQQTYGTPDAARLAIEAGGDLVLLCHEFMEARESLASLEKLSHPILHDVSCRLDKARSRLRTPSPYEEDQLAALASKISQINQEFPSESDGPDAESSTPSPVEDY